MYFRPILISIAVAGCNFIHSSAQQTNLTFATDSLNLDDCLSIALNNSPTIKVADMEIQRMDYSKKEVIGSFLPNIDFNATYGRTIAKQVMYMNMDAFGDFGGMGGGNGEAETQAISRAESKSSNNGIKVGLDNSYSMGFQASMPLISPQLWQNLSLSEEQIYRNVEAAKQSRQQLVSQIKNAYFALLLSQASKNVIQESYDMASLTHATYVKQHELGAASEFDVLRTSVAMKNIEPQITQANIAIKRTTLNLLLLMGLDGNYELKVKGNLSDYEKDMYFAALSANTEDLSNNADLTLLDIDKGMLKRNLKIQKLAYSPTLALSANYNWTSMSNGSPFKDFRWTPYSNIGLSLSVPIFSGGRRFSKVKQVEIQLAELNLQREQLRNSIEMQVKLAMDNIKLNVEQIESSSESVRQADTAHTIMQKSFAIGAASYLNLRDSELALTQARLAYYQAIYNFLIAHTELELLLGTAPIEKYSEK